MFILQTSFTTLYGYENETIYHVVPETKLYYKHQEYNQIFDKHIFQTYTTAVHEILEELKA